MLFSTRSRYGLILLLELALQYRRRPVQLKTIATEHGISEKYLGQIIIPLKTAGLVNSLRGAQGGYRLALPPAKITLIDVVNALDKETIQKEEPDRGGTSLKKDISRETWNQIADRLTEFLSGISLESLVGEYKKRADVGQYNI